MTRQDVARRAGFRQPFCCRNETPLTIVRTDASLSASRASWRLQCFLLQPEESVTSTLAVTGGTGIPRQR